MPLTKNGVGWKDRDTSQQAAHDMDTKAKSLRDQVLWALDGRTMSSERIALVLGRDYGSVQPRVSELAREGLVEDSGQRVLGRHGKRIIVWRLADPTEKCASCGEDTPKDEMDLFDYCEHCHARMFDKWGD